EKGKSKTIALAGKRKLTVNFRSVDKNGRARLKLSIPGVVESTVAVRPGGDVVLGGPAMPDGDGGLFVPATLNKVRGKWPLVGAASVARRRSRHRSAREWRPRFRRKNPVDVPPCATLRCLHAGAAGRSPGRPHE